MKYIFWLLLINIFCVKNFIYSYKWTVVDNEHVEVCTSETCSNNELNSYCNHNESFAKTCDKEASIIPFPRSQIKRTLFGLNGLRNRIATSFDASNMQYLNWDNDLANMAVGWVKKCIINYDPCDFIYKNDGRYTVGQTISFISEDDTTQTKLVISTSIRNWFSEQKDFNSSWIKSLPEGKGNNYTQMVWSNSSFVGCAAAKFEKGTFFVCNYSPKGNVAGDGLYKIGEMCSDCPLTRSSCSRVFAGLCGLDDPRADATLIKTMKILLILPIILLIKNY